jgi:malectin (di-glucose binding ER protein)
MSVAYPEFRISQEEEWQELQTVLQSEIFHKAPNLLHFLEYVAEQHFAGKEDQIKEYSIAVQALHRPEQFDPQSDTIVRVTAHALRKKLEHYYATEGAGHSIQLQLPAGKYVPQFIRKHQELASYPDAPVAASEQESPSQPQRPKIRRPRAIWVGSGILIAGLLAIVGMYIGNRRPATHTAKPGSIALPLNAAQEPVMRIRFGKSEKPYIDAAGQSWITEKYCQGGALFAHPGHEIQGTDDPAIFQEGREGKFQCRIPASPGKYQLQLLFADTAGDKEAARQVDLTINNRRADALDIVDEAGGDDIAIGKLYTGIHPMDDGSIHLDFTSDGAFINALEITLADSDGGQVFRMIAGPAVFRDDQGDTWFPERFFQGGRRTFHPDGLPKVANSRLFEWERYGHFHYLIPVVAGREYRVRLFFSEGWFGGSNGGPGGIGSRVFDVYCNGTTLLKDFDILNEEKNGASVITFDHVKPTAHGMLDLEFIPAKNYPLINAIEVEPET